MARVNWTNLPAWKRIKLEDRVRTREISATDIRRLQEWIASDPEVPADEWCKDFGSFKVVGKGSEPSSFLTRDQPCWGEKLS
jgi:hypothetical protein